MIRIERTSKIEVIQNAIREDWAKAYHIVIDQRNGDIVLMTRLSKTPHYIKVGEAKRTPEMRLNSRNVQKMATQVRKAVDEYNRTCYICYSKAVGVYGKKNVIDEAFVKEVDNPYYKCAGAMRLYDKNVIEYNLNMVS